MSVATGCTKRVISCTTIYSFSNCWSYIYVVKNYMYCSSKMLHPWRSTQLNCPVH